MSARDLAAAIRRGIPQLENHSHTLTGSGCGCALGAALVGAGLRKPTDRIFEMPAIDILSPFFGIPHHVLKEQSGRHFKGMATREQIADYFDSIDPSQPKDAEQFERFMAATLALPESVTREDEVTI